MGGKTMIGRRKILGAALAAPLLTAACARQTRADTLDDVIARHVEARGGAAALDRVRTCAIDLEINERGQTIPLRYYANVDRLARVDVMIDGQRAYSEGMDAQGVWLWPADAPAATPSVAEGAANALLHGVENNLVGLHRFQERGSRLTLQAPETIDEVAYHVIECAYPTTHVTNFYIDPQSWQIVRRRDRRAYHPDADQAQQNVETRNSDFQAVDGVIAAHLSEDYDLDSGALISAARVLTRRLNPDLPVGLFERTYTPV
jgi:hypothetical protein